MGIHIGRPSQAKFDWTDEAVEKIRAYLASGLTASQIAAALGPGVTRNSVIGKCHRDRIALKPPHRSTTGHLSTPKVTPIVGPAPATREFKPARKAIEAKRVIVPATTEERRGAFQFRGDGVSIVALRSADCRWPLGEVLSDEFEYCGRPRDVDVTCPYCADHARLAYAPLASKSTQEQQQQRRAQ